MNWIAPLPPIQILKILQVLVPQIVTAFEYRALIEVTDVT